MFAVLCVNIKAGPFCLAGAVCWVCIDIAVLDVRMLLPRFFYTECQRIVPNAADLFSISRLTDEGPHWLPLE